MNPTSLSTSVDLYASHVVSCDPANWKGACYAIVPPSIADAVAEAMDDAGSLVDTRETIGGMVRLGSRGYWAHGF